MSKVLTETPTTMTAAELMRLPDDGHRYELKKGELIAMVPAGARHGRIAMTLGSLLATHIRLHQLGVVCAAETGFRLVHDPDTVRAPDVSFVARQRISADGEPAGYWELAPDLAVEVVSPADSAAEVMATVGEYLAAGTRLVWVVYPQTETIVVYRSPTDIEVLTAEDMLEGEDVVPGFRVPVAQVFA